MKAITLLACALLATTAAAHEVHHTIAAGPAVTVALTYANGKPFAYEKYELTPEGAPIPVQVGNTDVQGRVVFVTGETKNWRLKAYTADGHGIDLRFAAPTTATIATTAPATTAIGADGPSRASLVLFGLGLILTGFGLLQLFFKSKKSP